MWGCEALPGRVPLEHHRSSGGGRVCVQASAARSCTATVAEWQLCSTCKRSAGVYAIELPAMAVDKLAQALPAGSSFQLGGQFTVIQLDGHGSIGCSRIPGTNMWLCLGAAVPVYRGGPSTSCCCSSGGVNVRWCNGCGMGLDTRRAGLHHAEESVGQTYRGLCINGAHWRVTACMAALVVGCRKITAPSPGENLVLR